VHILILTLYGFTVWLSWLAYALITWRAVGLLVFCGPLIISGCAITLAGVDFAVAQAIAWVRRARA